MDGRSSRRVVTFDPEAPLRSRDQPTTCSLLDEFQKGGVTLDCQQSTHSLFSSRPLRLALSGDVPSHMT